MGMLAALKAFESAKEIETLSRTSKKMISWLGQVCCAYFEKNSVHGNIAMQFTAKEKMKFE